MLVIGRLSRRIAPVPLAVAQFTVVSILSLIGAVLFETIDSGGSAERRDSHPLRRTCCPWRWPTPCRWWPSGAREPAHAAIILSFESVFAALGGWLVLGEGLSTRESSAAP